MATQLKSKKLRIEISITKQDSNFIRKHICEENETRKEAIERIINNTIGKTASKLQEVISSK